MNDLKQKQIKTANRKNTVDTIIIQNLRTTQLSEIKGLVVLSHEFFALGTQSFKICGVFDRSVMLFRSVSVSVEAKEFKTCRSLVEANCATVKSDDGFTLKSNDSLHFHSSSLLVEPNNSKSVLFEAADPSTSMRGRSGSLL